MRSPQRPKGERCRRHGPPLARTSRQFKIELLNKLLKVDEGLGDNALMCAFSLESHELAAIMLSVAQNIKVGTRFVEDQSTVERGDAVLPLCGQVVSPPNDTYFSGRLPETQQYPPGDPPPA